MRGRFGLSRKEQKKAMKEWENTMDAQSEDESDTSTSSDKENGNKKGKKSSKSSFAHEGEFSEAEELSHSDLWDHVDMAAVWSCVRKRLHMQVTPGSVS